MQPNLIGISGKTGSGKDTVGKIIQCLTANYPTENIVEILKGIGDYKLLPFSDETNWQIKKFAFKLKQIASILTGIPVEKFEDQDFKKKALGREWCYPTEWQGREHWIEITSREFLQKLGTEAMRDRLHTNVWINALFADYKPQDGLKGFVFTLKDGGKQFVESQLSYPSWIITDMRFPNEMEAVKERGGITIRVNRKIKIGGDDYGYTYVDVKQAVKDGIMAAEHLSETALDDAKFDYEINNDGTIENLITTIHKTLNHII